MFSRLSLCVMCFVLSFGGLQSPDMETTVNNYDKFTKQKEMLNATVLVITKSGSGSGVIIDRMDTETENMFSYYVLTNAHVIQRKYLYSVDSFSGRLKVTIRMDNHNIGVFDHKEQKWEYYTAEIVSEDKGYDLAILSFRSTNKLSVAKIATDDMLKQINIFNQVFTVGCPFGKTPMPSVGIISQIISETKSGKTRIIYGHTAQISPGSSGGGLFKKYGEHYYLIGVPYKVLISHNGQMISYLAYSISVTTVNDFLEQSVKVCP